MIVYIVLFCFVSACVLWKIFMPALLALFWKSVCGVNCFQFSQKFPNFSLFEKWRSLATVSLPQLPLERRSRCVTRCDTDKHSYTMSVGFKISPDCPNCCGGTESAWGASRGSEQTAVQLRWLLREVRAEHMLARDASSICLILIINRSTQRKRFSDLIGWATWELWRTQ